MNAFTSAAFSKSPLRNSSCPEDGFAEAASTELCSHFVSAQQAGLHNSDRGEGRGYFFRRRKTRGSEFGTGDATMCLVFQTHSNPSNQNNQTSLLPDAVPIIT